MHHATETIASENPKVSSLIRRRYRGTCRTGRRESERSMRPVAIVMLHEDIADVSTHILHVEWRVLAIENRLTSAERPHMRSTT